MHAPSRSPLCLPLARSVLWWLLLGASVGGCPGRLEDPERFLDAAVTDAPTVTDGPVPTDGHTDGPLDGPLATDVLVLPDAGPPCTLGAAWVEHTLLPTTCGVMYCHAASEPAAGLDLASPAPAGRLVGVHGSTMCRGVTLVDATHPGQSLLLVKLAASPPCGARMPLGGDPLTVPQMDCVRRWVADQIAASVVDAGVGGHGG